MARGGMRAPINSVKHYVHLQNSAVATGTKLDIVSIDAVRAPAVALSNQVKEGAVVKAIHLEYWLLGGGTAPDTTTQFDLVVLKLPGGAVAPTAAEMLNLGAYINKKNILFTSQGVINGDVANVQSLPIIRQWILIPKGKQRFGFGDKFTTVLLATGTTIRICGIAIYKEFI